MSEIHLSINLVMPPCTAVARWLPAEHSLIVGPNGEIPTAMYRTSIDTLTLSFNPDNKALVALDAYTNSATWERRSLSLPSAALAAALVAADTFDEHGIGGGSSRRVRYAYSEEQSVLRVQVGGGGVAQRIQCLSCLVAGLGDKGQLLELWITDLRT